MFVYRIEDSHGRGLFSGLYILSYMRAVKRRHNPYDMPCPESSEEEGSDLYVFYEKEVYEHGRGTLDSFLVFGCSSKKQLKQWVKYAEGRRTLSHHGIRFVKYKVEKQHIIRGHFQVVFNKDYAEKICELDPVTLKEAA